MGEQYTGSTRIFTLQRMEELLDQGVSLESTDTDGRTFLRHACADGKADIAKLLLERGADVNSRDNEGKTPLMSAALIGRSEIVTMLLEHGADPGLETSGGDSALKMAQRWGKKEIVQTLLERIEQGSAQRPVPASGSTREQSTHSPVESVVGQPITEKTEEMLVSRIGPLARCLPNPVSHPVLHDVVRRIRRIGQSETRQQGGPTDIDTTVVDVTVRQSEPPAQQDEFKMPELTIDDYIQALETIKRSPGDRIGILGALGATGLAAAGGAAASGSIAALFGATTLLSSSTLGTLLGGVLVTTTPVGWVIGSAAAAAAVGYGLTKLVRSGAKADVVKEINAKDLAAKIEELRAAADTTQVPEEKFGRLVESFQWLVKNKRISQSDCTEYLAGVQTGLISYEYAFATVEKLSQQQEVKSDAQQQ